MQALTSVLDTGMSAYVFRGRVDPLNDSEVPAVGVFQGAEDPIDEDSQQNFGFIDAFLSVRTEVAAKETQPNIETELNELRRQVHLLLMPDTPPYLGLAYVLDVRTDGVEEPALDGSTEYLIGTMVCNWIVYYRYQREDAGAAP